MDVPGRSGNTLQVLGSRPRRPTIGLRTFMLVGPNGRNIFYLERIFFSDLLLDYLTDLSALTVSQKIHTESHESRKGRKPGRVVA